MIALDADLPIWINRACEQHLGWTQQELAADTIAALQAAVELARGEQVKTTRMRSSFLASMSHELRTPLNAIIGYAEILIEDAEAGDIDIPEHDLRRILASTNHLLALINDILDLSHLESQRIELHHDRVDLDHLLRSAAEAIRPAAERASNKLIIDLDRSPRVMWGDRAHLSGRLQPARQRRQVHRRWRAPHPRLGGHAR